MGNDLAMAKAMNTDAVIVFVHWGSEYQSLPSKWQKDVAAYCFQKGAQLVIGAHPHVLQPMEWSKEKNQLVAYSLGNFVSGQRKRYTDGGGMITLDFQKVTFPDSSSITTIDTANYILEWVYRTTDSQKNYHVLPVPSFENDTTGFIRDSASREAFKTFVTDSRALYKKHNIGVDENTSIASDSLVTFKIEVLVSATKVEQFVAPLPYGVEEDTQADGSIVYYSGEFRRIREAQKYLEKLRAVGYHNASIRKFVNGRRE